MPYNFVADIFHTKKLCSKQTFFKQSAIFTENGCFAFLSPPLGAYGQRTMFILGSLESA